MRAWREGGREGGGGGGGGGGEGGGGGGGGARGGQRRRNRMKYYHFPPKNDFSVLCEALREALCEYTSGSKATPLTGSENNGSSKGAGLQLGWLGA